MESAPLLDLDEVPKPSIDEDLDSPVVLKTATPLGHSHVQQPEESVVSPQKERLHTGHSQHHQHEDAGHHPTESLILSHQPDGTVNVSGDVHHLPNGGKFRNPVENKRVFDGSITAAGQH